MLARVERELDRRWSRAALRRHLERSRAYRATRSVVLALDEHGAVRAASAIAFDAFLSLIPLVAFAGYVLSRIHQSSALVLDPLIQSAPRAVAQAVSAEFVRMSMSSAVAPISITGFLWMSSAGVSTAMGVFETMYAANERPWYVRRAIAAGCVLASLAVVPLAALLGVAVGTLGSLGARLVAFTLPSALLVFLVAAFFRIAIRQRDVERRRIFPGALATVALWAVVSALFSLYVATLARYATFYGSLATTAIFLLWLWLLALALMVGGEVNARLERERLGLTSIRPAGSSSSPPDADAIPRAPPVPVETITAADAAARGQAPVKRSGASVETTQRSGEARAGRRSDAPTRRSGELGRAAEIAERVAAGATSIDTTMRSSGVGSKRAAAPAPAEPAAAGGEEDATATVAAIATTPPAAPAITQRGAALDPKRLASSE